MGSLYLLLWFALGFLSFAWQKARILTSKSVMRMGITSWQMKHASQSCHGDKDMDSFFSPQIGESIQLCAKSLQSCPTCATLRTVAHQAPLSKGFSRQEYWMGLHSVFSRGPCQHRDQPGSLMSPALAGEFFTTSATWEAWSVMVLHSPSENGWLKWWQHKVKML